MSPPPTILERIKTYPKHLVEIGKGFLEAFLTNVEMTLFFVLAILVGLASNFWLGAAVGFGLYTFFYVISLYVELLNSNFLVLVRLMSEVINESQRSED